MTAALAAQRTCLDPAAVRRPPPLPPPLAAGKMEVDTKAGAAEAIPTEAGRAKTSLRSALLPRRPSPPSSLRWGRTILLLLLLLLLRSVGSRSRRSFRCRTGCPSRGPGGSTGRLRHFDRHLRLPQRRLHSRPTGVAAVPMMAGSPELPPPPPLSVPAYSTPVRPSVLRSSLSVLMERGARSQCCHLVPPVPTRSCRPAAAAGMAAAEVGSAWVPFPPSLLVV